MRENMEDLDITGTISHRGYRGSSLYRARSKTLKASADVTVRVIKLNGESKQSLQSLEDHASRCLTLLQTNILRWYDYAYLEGSRLGDGPQFWIKAELCTGGTIREALGRQIMTPDLLKNWSHQVLSGLAYLHGRHIVHSNITGHNILLSSTDFNKCTLKIGDLAAITQLQGATALPNEVPFCGTLSYMPPEMFMQYFLPAPERQFIAGTKIDIWSFGCLCVEMMTGAHPQYEAPGDGDDELEIADSYGVPKLRAMRAIVAGALPTVLKKCSLGLIEFILHCLELNPETRWDAKALLESRFYQTDAHMLEWDVSTNTADLSYEKEEFLVGGNYGVHVHLGRLIINGFRKSEIVIKSTPLPPKGEQRERYIFASRRRALKILKLDHPYVVRHIHYRYHISKDQPQCVVLMEYCSGGTLAAAVRRQRPDPAQFQTWCRQILLGIEYLHYWLIIHRDIKGENIFLSTEDRSTCVLKIGDLDDIKILNKERTEGENVSFRGTNAFISAEMRALTSLMNDNLEYSVGRKTDIWSYGCVVLQMWAGKSPTYINEESVSVTLTPFTTSREGPSLPSDLPTEVLDFVNRCLEVDAKLRPDASELLGLSFFVSSPPC